MGGWNSKTLTCNGLIKLVEKRNAVEIIYDEHKEIMNMEVEGTLSALTSAEHLENSQPEKEEMWFEHSRVILSEETSSSNYINASYIDGFKRPKAYIVTRTPDSEATTRNFWKMIWEHQTEIIVMLNKSDENGNGISYWNPEEGSSVDSGKLKIQTIKVHETHHPKFQITSLLVTHEDGDELYVNHFLFKDWQRDDISPSECDFLDLVFMSRLYDRSAGTSVILKAYKSPIVVHCSDGLQRSMVFCAIDISISRILKLGKVNLYSIVSKLRQDRYNCLYDANDYGFCYLALYYYSMFYM
ncbi:tyrosine-protein phosphatase non-receptor type 9-like [Bacillus rossius redtenbacheri]|uniref:tyrosine-protein phosphatase non-receptor type 9-like n=1 Tax=Bacillus rossius redtenbacheri TaxID=93214 RepID=UPI002FDD2BF7